MKINHFSYSRNNLWNQCQLKYKFQYHDQIYIEDKKEWSEFGKYIHMVLDLFVKKDISIEESSKLSYAKYNKFGKQYKDLIPTVFKNFLDFNDQIYDGSKVTDDFSEVAFSLENDGVKWKGFIDRIIYYQDKILIVDYKTSKEANEVSREDAQNDNQLMIYAFFANHQFNIPYDKIFTMLFYLRSNHKVITSFSEEKIHKKIKFLSRTAKKIKNTPPESAKPSITKLCDFCEYRNMCSSYQKYLVLRGIKK